MKFATTRSLKERLISLRLLPRGLLFWLRFLDRVQRKVFTLWSICSLAIAHSVKVDINRLDVCQNVAKERRGEE